MKNEKNGKIIVMMSLFMAIVTLAVGFAAFSNTLTISSSATVSPDPKEFKLAIYGLENEESWNFVSTFEPEIYTSSTKSVGIPMSINGTASAEDAVISSEFTAAGTNQIKITNLKANLNQPFDVVNYLFMIKNEGEYDAYLRASEFNKLININDKTVCKSVVTEGEEAATQEYIDAVCKDISINVSVVGSETMDTLFSSDNTYTDEYIKIPKAGSSFIGRNYGYAFIDVAISYNGNNRVDGNITIDFADIELEFTTVPPAE